MCVPAYGRPSQPRAFRQQQEADLVSKIRRLAPKDMKAPLQKGY